MAPSQRQVWAAIDALPASLAHLKRRISDKKWKEAQEWSLVRTKNPRFDTKRPRQTTDPTPAKAPKR